MPLGLLTLASLVRPFYEVVVYEPKYNLVESDDYVIVVNDILSYKPDIVAFSTWCISYPAVILIAEKIRSITPEIPIIFGGPQASISARETLTYFPFIDYILKGEADLTFPRFLNEIFSNQPNLESLPGLVYRNNLNNIVENSSDPPIQNLDELPYPAYDLFPIKETIKLDIGRGCPFKCTYCTTNDFFSKRYRTKSPDRIIREMLTVREKMRISNIGFAHDMLTLNRKFVFELCDRLIQLKNEKGIEFKWTCSARIDCISEEMLVKMKKAGCESVFFGIESGSPRVQKQIQKNLDIKKSYELADTCRAIGINMFASFILGFPDETELDLEMTLETLIRLALNGSYVQSSILALLPGTPLYESNKNKLKLDDNFSNFSNTICGNEELKLIREFPDVFSSFYYLPVKILRRKELVFLSKMINKMVLFRNTIFLLEELISSDIENYRLLEVFKDIFKQLHQKKQPSLPIVIYWIHILFEYIQAHHEKIHDYVDDIFNLESSVALTLTINSNRKLLKSHTSSDVINDNVVINPTSGWKILKTKYILERIIPSNNGWIKDKKRLRKGDYFYLIVVISPIKCKKIRLKQKDVTLLENLSKLYLKDYVNKVKSLSSKTETLLWIKKMRRLGVVEISSI